MEWFAAHGLIEQHPAVAVHGALIYALIGHGGRRRALGDGGRAHDLPSARCRTATRWRARSPTCGRPAVPQRPGRDAPRRPHRARGPQPDQPLPRRRCCTPRGWPRCSRATSTEADLFFSRAVDEAVAAPASCPSSRSLLAERGIVAIERDGWSDGRQLAAQALAIMGQRELDDYWTSALVYAWAARVAVPAGRRGAGAGPRDAGGPAAAAAHLRAARSCRCRRCWSWLAPTSRSASPAARAPRCGQIDDVLRHRPRAR